MKITDTPLSPQALDLLTGVLSLPAIALCAVGLVALFGLALLGGICLQVLRVPARIALHSLSGPRHPAAGTHQPH